MADETSGRSPYALCARSVGTTTGGKSCHYDWAGIPISEVRAYALFHAKRGTLPFRVDGLTDAELRQRVMAWYEGGSPERQLFGKQRRALRDTGDDSVGE